MKQYITGICAFIIAIAAAAFTVPQPANTTNTEAATYYFQFMGAHHDESDVTQWQEISFSAYNSLLCSRGGQGCSIATSAVSNPGASFPNRTISSVPVNGDDEPQVSTNNIEVKNKPLP